MKRKLFAGITSVSLPIVVQDTSSTTGGGLAGVVFNSAGIVAEYRRQGQSTWTAITLVTNTLGTYTSGGFIVDGARVGAYEFCPPDAAFAAGARWVAIRIRGVTNMYPVDIEVELDVVNYQSATAFITGVNAQTYPAFVPGASGGLATIDASLRVSANVTAIGGTATTYDANNLLNVNVKDWNGTATTLLPLTDKAGYSLSGSQTFNTTGNLSGSVGSVTGAVGSVTGTVGAALSVSGTVGAAASVTAPVTVGTNNDKTGYSLSASQSFSMSGNISGNISGNVSGSVGSVAGNVSGSVGSVTGTVGTALGIAAGGITSSSFAAGSLAAAAFAAGALNGKGDWLLTTGYTAPDVTSGPAVLNMTTGTGTSRQYTVLSLANGPAGSGGGATNVNVIQWGGTNVGAMPGASSAGIGNVPVNHNTGGANNLLMTLNSVATAGIQIEAYLTSVYTAGNYGPPTSLGQATSIADGTWKAPIMIAAPASGTIGVTLVVSDAGKAPQATTTVTVSSAGTATTP